MRRVLLTLLLCATVSVAAAANGALLVDAADFNFGKVIEGTIVVHTFILSNPGPQPIEIKKVRASCGCTAMALSDYSLDAGESVQLDTRVDTSGFGGDVVKSIYVDYMTGSSESKTLTLHVAGNVSRAQPYHITVGDLNYLFYILIDLRDAEAYAAGHLMGAINIPYGEFAAWAARLPKGVIIVLYDQDGALSDEIAQALFAQGYSDARSLQGGLNAWTIAYDEQFILEP
ncbi:MAG: DUF1573 domain-containing protein [Candidatus Bipolaricaulis sp.]|nr:DUF1573 domain-containing protein [Candidatus Bipolaricaulis sp.]MDD5646351.1 DUF1573 domain-containing protein [Candidatus Bipolaricaulis sp.]